MSGDCKPMQTPHPALIKNQEFVTSIDSDFSVIVFYCDFIAIIAHNPTAYCVVGVIKHGA